MRPITSHKGIWEFKGSALTLELVPTGVVYLNAFQCSNPHNQTWAWSSAMSVLHL